MTQTIHELMQGNLLQVFNERDSERRRAAVSRIYAPDVGWTDDEGVTVQGACRGDRLDGVVDRHIPRQPGVFGDRRRRCREAVRH